MRILSIHNAYQIRGGEDVSTAAEQTLLRDHGHTVDVYEENNDSIKDMGAVQLAARTLWSKASYGTVRAKLRAHRYDIVHVQNFFPLISPSVYYAARAENVPVVQTLRNYRLICPNALFFRDGKVCEDCMGKAIPYPGIVHGCYREDRKASAAVASMVTSHRLLRTWPKMVDQYITLTQFARNKMIEGGLPADKIVVKPNFVAPEPKVGSGQGGYALYVGRLSVEKGLDTLLAAWKQLENPIPLKIVGDGPLSTLVTEAAAQQPCIEWLGRRPMAEVHRLMGEAQCLIFPSKWYETFGRVAVEAFATGTPVIAANIGAIAEIVTPGHTGLHFTPGDPRDLARQVTWMLTHSEQQALMGRQARREFEQKYTAAANYAQLMAVYLRVLPAASFHQNSAALTVL
ncbi:MAG: glycosyltransferase [Cyanobacteria bacterium P01_H01_bin.26]